jgi:hypothetical protein
MYSEGRDLLAVRIGIQIIIFLCTCTQLGGNNREFEGNAKDVELRPGCSQSRT